ncbi:DUF4383 domain-containing protein [Spirilliplanes yamanashiensis]|uniref:DUF4383 domain-containing protein n=1 Tax=Spirilliplanes yamanashiensis TaxID=42233 RepID=A0A8J3Y3Y7_9ACTN|nr:DUF4383 domain-containing protein [Spirilliplanes yamanashiensis]MDP9820020.1 hypothetical protein [Spirilliplanes yamanashiensis]GIJ01160.1 hypothetical protein Sya03_05120 [Spirilliplanes yamanashiensis]
MASHTGSGVVAGHKLNSLVAVAFGAVFVLVGLAGFFVSGGHHPAGTEGGELAGLFQVNVLHNVVHLAAGAAMVAAAIVGSRQAKRANTVIGLLYLLLFVAGLFLVGTPANVVALNDADNVLHLVLGLALTAAGLGFDRD